MDEESPGQRKIIHCDADCFYAAIEMRDDPMLRGRPIAVGGSRDRRGVISTCNYEARRFGVHSAMSSAQALNLCPDLLLLPHRFDAYREASQQIREVFFEYTDLVEPLSLDEAYLDVSEADNCRGSATRMAEEIRQKVRERVGITVSAGVAPNKFLAKVASDWNKPDGLWVIPPAAVDEFVLDLPVERIHGVGKVTAAKLHRLGIRRCGDIRRWDRVELAERFGSFGMTLYNYSRGIDGRSVKPSHRRKSLSVEHTYPTDLQGFNACSQHLPELYRELSRRLDKLDGQYRVVKQFIKIKFNNFQSTTMEVLSETPRISLFQHLCRQAYERQSLPVRLLGMGVRLLDLQEGENPQQLVLFE